MPSNVYFNGENPLKKLHFLLLNFIGHIANFIEKNEIHLKYNFNIYYLLSEQKFYRESNTVFSKTTED